MKNDILIKTAIACVACDGNISKEEVDLLESMYPDTPLVTILYDEIRSKGVEFIKGYIDILISTDFTEDEELQILDIAYKSIIADKLITYSEISFFKVIRSLLNVTDEHIIESFPEIDRDFLSQDIQCSPEQNINSYLKTAAPTEIIYNSDKLENSQLLL